MKKSNYYYNRLKKVATKKNIKEFVIQAIIAAYLIFMFVIFFVWL